MKKLSGALIVVLLSLVLWLPSLLAGDLQVHFIDVGQGDSTLIVTPGGKKMLIDAGIHSAATDARNPFLYIEKLKEQGGISDTNIDLAIITHAHDDHYGGFNYLKGSKANNDFPIAAIYFSVDDAKAYGTFWPQLNALKKQSKAYGQIWARGPPAIKVDEDVYATVLYPLDKVAKPNYNDKNADSVVILLTYKDASFLFTGDAPSAVEKIVIDNNKALKASVVKLGHHGSNTASSPDFLKAVKPENGFYAIISANDKDGKGKTYGHPHRETLETLKSLGNVHLFRTDLQGTVIAVTDGNEIQVSAERNDVGEALWQPGRKSSNR